MLRRDKALTLRGKNRHYRATMSFSDLGLSEEVCRAVTDAGYTVPTPIQAQAIPLILMSRDLMATAQTGTGKTAAFTLPMIDILAGNRARARMPRSLILEPTRELANQVAENFDKYGKFNKLSKALIIGGENMEDQIKLLDRGVDVLIATPGRLLDLFERGRILLNDIKVLVIDEADRMLDMGFIPDIEKICKLLSPMRQTLMFSATLAPEIKRLADQFLMNPKSVSVAPPASTNVNVEQFLVETTERNKREVLRHLLRTRTVKNAFIFCNRKKDIGVLQRSLERHGFNAAALHGDMVQSARTATLEAFKADRVALLICSDVAARGLDVSDVSHVFNFDVPIHSEDYVHRIGRTGRAGKTGEAFTLATSDDAKFVDAIERLIKKPIPRFAPEGFTPSAENHAMRSEEAPRRERGGRDRPHRNDRGPRPPRSESPTPRPEAAAPQRPESSQRSEQRLPRRDDRPARYDDNVDALPAGTTGFGDDLPAFLKRPVKL
jgi:superfamily II DNA/RNA helicase